MSPSRGRLIVLEGLCGVGKTTIATALSASIGAIVVATVSEEYSTLRRYLDQCRSVDARYAFFLSAALMTSTKVDEFLASGRDVVIESYIYRVVAFHKGMGATMSVRLPHHFLWPTYCFMLECSDKERTQRCSGREASREREKAYWDALAEQNAEAILKQYERFPAYRVQTSCLSPDECVRSIVSIINNQPPADTAPDSAYL